LRYKYYNNIEKIRTTVTETKLIKASKMKKNVILSLAAYAEANLRIATLSDLHLFEYYEPGYDSKGSCWPNSAKASLLD